jgi:flagellar hook protein FlgE
MFTAVSGMNANGQGLSVVGDNIANMNTHAFKSSRVVFGDVVSQSMGSSGIGRGVLLSDVSPMFTQGSFENSSSVLDMAVDGDGLFVLKTGNSTYYTRAGQFMIDKQGYAVSPHGHKLQGYQFTAAGATSTLIADINVASINSQPRATTDVSVYANLDARASIPINSTPRVTSNVDMHVNLDSAGAVTGPFVVGNPVATSNFSNTVTVYDSGQNARTLNVYYTKTAANVWQWNAVVSAADAFSGADTIGGTGNLTFLASGALSNQATTLDDFDFAGGVTQSQSIAFDLGRDIVNDSSTGFEDTTQFASSSSTIYSNQDGYVSGFDIVNPENTSNFTSTITVYDSLGNSRIINIYYRKNQSIVGGAADGGNEWQWYAVTSGTDNDNTIDDDIQAYGLLRFDTTGALYEQTTTMSEFDFEGGPTQDQPIMIAEDGLMTGIFTNGQTKPVARIVLAKFIAPAGLIKLGDNLYAESYESGQPIVTQPGNTGTGSVLSNTLELSNVDLAAEFVKMIIMQRGFQANSKMVSTSDELMMELVNLKR